MDRSSLAYLCIGALLVLVGFALAWRVKPDRLVRVSHPAYTVATSLQVSPPCDDGREVLAMGLTERHDRGPR
jgi:hypothetical protein